MSRGCRAGPSGHLHPTQLPRAAHHRPADLGWPRGIKVRSPPEHPCTSLVPVGPTKRYCCLPASERHCAEGVRDENGLLQRGAPRPGAVLTEEL